MTNMIMLSAAARAVAPGLAARFERDSRAFLPPWCGTAVRRRCRRDPEASARALADAFSGADFDRRDLQDRYHHHRGDPRLVHRLCRIGPGDGDRHPAVVLVNQGRVSASAANGIRADINGAYRRCTTPINMIRAGSGELGRAAAAIRRLG
jgi:hypothetical protein